MAPEDPEQAAAVLIVRAWQSPAGTLRCRITASRDVATPDLHVDVAEGPAEIIDAVDAWLTRLARQWDTRDARR